MSKSIVITLVGDDRPGIVEALSEIIVEHEGDWVESRMANLCGKFAGILRVVLPDGRVDDFYRALDKDIDGLNLTAEKVSSASESAEGQCFRMQLVGQNQPGIIHAISSAIAEHGATVDEIESEIIDASMSGEKLFRANIVLCLPSEQNAEELRDLLEDIANELIVDIELG